MAGLVPLVFPFRRLVAWLAALVVLVSLLALAVSALVVVPFLDQRLLDQRLEQVDRAASTSGPSLAAAIAQNPYRASDYAAQAGRLTATTVYLYDTLTPGSPMPISDPVGPTDDPLVRAAAKLATNRRVSAVVQRGDQNLARSAIALDVRGERWVALYEQPADDVGAIKAVLSRRLLIAGLIALPAAALVGVLAAIVLAARIRRLERAAQRIAGGSFDTPVTDAGRDEIGQLASAFDEMRERLADADRARREFIANASHELRTPLFALGGYVELLEDDPGDAEATAEFAAAMRTQVERLTRLATDLLDLSRIDAGRLELHREPVELGESAQGVVDEFRPRAEQRGTFLAVAPGRAVALADELRVTQILRALVENALRHNPGGAHVEIVPGERGPLASVAVHDDGPPIAEGDRDRVFERFERASTGEGSGIGLAIARELAVRMGGDLRLVHDPDGKAFVLDLPAAGEDAGEPSLATTHGGGR